MGVYGIACLEPLTLGIATSCPYMAAMFSMTPPSDHC